VSGAGGVVIYDRDPQISYRQHAANLVGANTGVNARLQRLRLLADGRWYDWIETNLAALKAKRHLLSSENRNVLDGFVAMRCGANPVRRLQSLRGLGLYRQNRLGNASMAVAVMLRKF